MTAAAAKKMGYTNVFSLIGGYKSHGAGELAMNSGS